MLLDITFKVTTSRSAFGYVKARVEADKWPTGAQILLNMADEFRFGQNDFVMMFNDKNCAEENAALINVKTIERIEVISTYAVDEGE